MFTKKELEIIKEDVDAINDEYHHRECIERLEIVLKIMKYIDRQENQNNHKEE